MHVTKEHESGGPQPFDLAGITYTVGAPSFAQFAKGGNLERMRNGVCAKGQESCRQHRYPSLQRTQGRGTHCVVTSAKSKALGTRTRPPPTQAKTGLEWATLKFYLKSARSGQARRVAQAFDLAGITNTVGAPSFAQFAKGGNL
jgi:hypothetical protein